MLSFAQMLYGQAPNLPKGKIKTVINLCPQAQKKDGKNKQDRKDFDYLILESIRDGANRLSEIVAETGISMHAVKNRIKKFEKANLVRVELKQGHGGKHWEIEVMK